jgi:hypothetical protein
MQLLPDSEPTTRILIVSMRCIIDDRGPKHSHIVDLHPSGVISSFCPQPHVPPAFRQPSSLQPDARLTGVKAIWGCHRDCNPTRPCTGIPHCTLPLIPLSQPGVFVNRTCWRSIQLVSTSGSEVGRPQPRCIRSAYVPKSVTHAST